MTMSLIAIQSEAQFHIIHKLPNFLDIVGVDGFV